eukprot:8339828-Lingulodinium_polyedra.AAC.1
MARSWPGFRLVPGPKAGRSPSGSSHSSGGGARVWRSQSCGRLASKRRSCAAGPPLRAATQRLEPGPRHRGRARR